MTDTNKVDSNPNHVICPGCCHQFRAIPFSVQEELAALRAENESLRASLYGLFELEKERDNLRTQLQEAQTDAARYRWLFDDSALAEFKRCCEANEPLPDIRTTLLHDLLGFVISRAAIDAIIDAAIAKAEVEK